MLRPEVHGEANLLKETHVCSSLNPECSHMVQGAASSLSLRLVLHNVCYVRKKNLVGAKYWNLFVYVIVFWYCDMVIILNCKIMLETPSKTRIKHTSACYFPNLWISVSVFFSNRFVHITMCQHPTEYYCSWFSTSMLLESDYEKRTTMSAATKPTKNQLRRAKKKAAKKTEVS